MEPVFRLPEHGEYDGSSSMDAEHVTCKDSSEACHIAENWNKG